MLEVVFDVSTKYTMKALEENSNEVAAIGFHLDVGCIDCDIDSKERRDTFTRLYHSVVYEKEEIDHFFQSQRQDLEKLVCKAKSGAKIRIWKSNAPFSACAYSFLCDVLSSIDCGLTVISLPEYILTSQNTIMNCSDWSKIMPDQFFEFLPLERDIPEMEKHYQSKLWHKLKAENAAMRALVNGSLISVPDHFYDHLILKEIPSGEFAMIRLIGNILGKYPIGVTDGWYALRIQKLIDENYLQIICNKDPEHPYGVVLRRVKQGVASV